MKKTKLQLLVVGSGGREHALAWKLAQSPRVGKIYAAPGNPGTAAFCENVSIAANDVPGLTQFAVQQGIDKGRFPRSDLARERHEPAGSVHAIQQMGETVPVALAQEEASGIRRDRERLRRQPEVRRIHGALRLV